MPIRILSVALSLLLVAAAAARASLPGAEVCEQAAAVVAAETGVPADILGALTLTETGRRAGGAVRPWAWSVNAAGRGTWFDGPRAAVDFAQAEIARGQTNVDIGCFQLNWRWHGRAFASVDRMFDPLENARYAAGFLRRLHAELGDWRAAAGAFHSRRPAHAARYLARFDQLRARLAQSGFDGLDGAPETYNSFAADEGGGEGSILVAAGESPAAPEPRTPLGLPLGAPLTGSPGSLAALAPAGDGAPSALIVLAAAGPLLTLGGP